MKKFIKLGGFMFVGIAVLVILIGVGSFVWWRNVTSAPSLIEGNERFLITKGMSATQIGNKLSEEKIIKNSFAFKFYTQLTGKSQEIQAGEYSLPKNKNLYLVIAEILKGPSQVWVTVPEGLRREEIAFKFADGLGKTGSERSAFIDEFIKDTQGKEGYLFPDTYLVAKDISVIKVVSAMENTFEKQTSDFQKDIENSQFSLNQIVTIASLIEREAKGVEERPMIAGVILNRLKDGWPLQIDAAVQYAIASKKLEKGLLEPGKYWAVLTKEDLEIASPFNTYAKAGIPPSPISNPGITSLEAAVYPTSNDYYFYIHDDSGQIHFAKTIEEHNANVRKYLGK